MKKFFVSILFLFFLTTQCFAEFSTETAPYNPSGKIDGFKLMFENSKATRLISVGVLKNDVVIAVNGKPIQSMRDAETAYSISKIREVIVLRNNKPVTLHAEESKQ